MRRALTATHPPMDTHRNRAMLRRASRNRGVHRNGGSRQRARDDAERQTCAPNTGRDGDVDGHACEHQDRTPPLHTDPPMTNELPSVAMTARFLALCDHYGAERLAIRIVAAGRNAGVDRLPQHDNWPDWNSREMRAAVEYLERQCGRR